MPTRGFPHLDLRTKISLSGDVFESHGLLGEGAEVISQFKPIENNTAFKSESVYASYWIRHDLVRKSAVECGRNMGLSLLKRHGRSWQSCVVGPRVVGFEADVCFVNL